MVERANAAGADLIVVTGDFIDGTVAMRATDVEPLRDRQAPHGIYAVPGNHEYYFGYQSWMRHLGGLGIRMLPNAHAVVTRGGTHLVVAGVTDLSAPQHDEVGADLNKRACWRTGRSPGAAA